MDVHIESSVRQKELKYFQAGTLLARTSATCPTEYYIVGTTHLATRIAINLRSGIHCESPDALFQKCFGSLTIQETLDLRHSDLRLPEHGRSHVPT